MRRSHLFSELRRFVHEFRSTYQSENLKVLANRSISKIIVLSVSVIRRFFDRIKTTYEFSGECCKFLSLRPEIISVKLYQLPILFEYLPLRVAEHYCDHRFDLLGSGWTKVYYGMKCRGLDKYIYHTGEPCGDISAEWLADHVNRSNLAEAKRIWNLIPDKSYVPIDWHVDFKSGYRWRGKTWYQDIVYGQVSGVDVKVPRELARMQHLPQMALLYLSLTATLEKKERLKREFVSQMLDFIAANPPRYGVNWQCTMDVAIRAANCVVAYAFFRIGNVQFDPGFDAVFTRSIHEHGCHVISNLEGNDKTRGNHYLADIAGLVFIAAYLPATSKTDFWMAFAIQELIREVERQFYPDGGNFEGSTAYHRLSAEMVYFATAVVLGLPMERIDRLRSYDNKGHYGERGKAALQPGPMPLYSLPAGSSGSSVGESPFPTSYFERMERMAEFIMDITKPSGQIPQIGDNDSGRFLKLAPQYQSIKVKEAKARYANLGGYSALPDEDDYYIEDQLDCRHLIGAAYGIFTRPDFAEWLGGTTKAEHMPDRLCICGLSGGVTIGSQRLPSSKTGQNETFVIGNDHYQQTLDEILKTPKGNYRVAEYPLSGQNTIDKIILCPYPDFGIYIFKSERVYLAVRCWPRHVPYRLGHMHNDQLSIELVINGRELIRDPGSYLYTPVPEIRNRYKSFQAHFSPWSCNEEKKAFCQGPFAMPDIPGGKVIYFGRRGFIGEVLKDEVGKFVLYIAIEKSKITVTHSSPYPLSKYSSLDFSPAYGTIFNHRCVSAEAITDGGVSQKQKFNRDCAAERVV